ncbi:MAG: bifunctional phosphopantothenoylcysteine decarboxylase/phosphopantothenate--cysteine ligase CoaBC [Actinomycetota bacterium]|nr:bifunctional phosphopantothenoylcysteine decarboxylase/phosphopantothenate--cysteine ligase CoaBC [Actinomycetota bacterium]
MLKDKTVILGVAGGIASYKSVELSRVLIERGARVKVVMTSAATKFITPLTFRTITRQSVATDLFEADPSAKIHHISLAEEADIILVAPATANFIAKVANGVADDLLTTTILASDCPKVIAPAMNHKMFLNPLTEINIGRLSSLGFYFVGPSAGELACGISGPGRLAPLADIVNMAEFALTRSSDLSGKRVLVTAGGTREPIDPVRYISNRSSGKMGYEIARELISRGAKVTLVSGASALTPPSEALSIRVITASEMGAVIKEHFSQVDALVMAAAVSDFLPISPSSTKIKKQASPISITLKKAPDILASISKDKGERYVVAFSAETDNLIDNSLDKMKKKGADLIVCNDVSRDDIGFESDDNEVIILDREGNSTKIPRSSKRVIARAIVDSMVEGMSARNRR